MSQRHSAHSGRTCRNARSTLRRPAGRPLPEILPCPHSKILLIVIYGGGIVGPFVGGLPFAVFKGAEEAAFVAFVADAGADGFDVDEDGVAVTAGSNRFEKLA